MKDMKLFNDTRISIVCIRMSWILFEIVLDTTLQINEDSERFHELI
jgi:hypothetical protein